MTVSTDSQNIASLRAAVEQLIVQMRRVMDRLDALEAQEAHENSVVVCSGSNSGPDTGAASTNESRVEDSVATALSGLSLAAILRSPTGDVIAVGPGYDFTSSVMTYRTKNKVVYDMSKPPPEPCKTCSKPPISSKLPAQRVDLKELDFGQSLSHNLESSIIEGSTLTDYSLSGDPPSST
ncbi:hypothetical protein BC829DRAFT_444078 [Chytridium lagenaria]|nr:hypothetical protein BC829DRAFT_444078 [Chytridium lagenaria]